MRCYTCGFTNTNGSKICEKCGTKLKAPAEAPVAGAIQPVPNVRNAHAEGIPTMRGAISQQPAWDAVTETEFKCDACGHYPLKSQVSKENPCPNCKSTGVKEVHNGTMSFPNLFFGKVTASSTSKIKLVDIATDKPLEFEGDNVVLNRSNLNPNDQSISSAQHVQFKKEIDTWHITDLSSNHATFIQVNGKVAIESGSHILIGNRIYRVEFD